MASPDVKPAPSAPTGGGGLLRPLIAARREDFVVGGLYLALSQVCGGVIPEFIRSSLNALSTGRTSGAGLSAAAIALLALVGALARVQSRVRIFNAGREVEFVLRERMLERLVEEKWLRARAVVGFFAANSADDDITVFADDQRQTVRATLHCLRQQKSKPQGHAQSSLADFVAPQDSGRADYIGAFAVTAGIGIDAHVARFEAAHDDYSSIMLKALADRLAEALAERMHERVRRDLWGYAPHERLDGSALIQEKYQGIRPAPGYPACPEHSEKATLWQLLDPQRNAGISLTESFAMLPTAAVSGFYFSHPQAHYFGVGQIDRDQAVDYAARKGWSLSEAERWLAPNLGYDPAPADAA